MKYFIPAGTSAGTFSSFCLFCQPPPPPPSAPTLLLLSPNFFFPQLLGCSHVPRPVTTDHISHLRASRGPLHLPSSQHRCCLQTPCPHPGTVAWSFSTSLGTPLEIPIEELIEERNPLRPGPHQRMFAGKFPLFPLAAPRVGAGGVPEQVPGARLPAEP